MFNPLLEDFKVFCLEYRVYLGTQVYRHLRVKKKVLSLRFQGLGFKGLGFKVVEAFYGWFSRFS